LNVGIGVLKVLEVEQLEHDNCGCEKIFCHKAPFLWSIVHLNRKIISTAQSCLLF